MSDSPLHEPVAHRIHAASQPLSNRHPFFDMLVERSSGIKRMVFGSHGSNLHWNADAGAQARHRSAFQGCWPSSGSEPDDLGRVVRQFGVTASVD
jgi:hypothetical protein